MPDYLQDEKQPNVQYGQHWFSLLQSSKFSASKFSSILKFMETKLENAPDDDCGKHDEVYVLFESFFFVGDIKLYYVCIKLCIVLKGYFHSISSFIITFAKNKAFKAFHL